MILITHYMEEVVDADKIFVMDHGKVVMEGSPKEIFSKVDELKSYRLDVPQVTILADELRKTRTGYSERDSEKRRTGRGSGTFDK